jgi:ABC-type branched-subunit amino acid transport system substrate-binding protein
MTARFQFRIPSFHSKWCVSILLILTASPVWPQYTSPQTTSPQKSQKEALDGTRYADMPAQAVPFRRFRKPYQEWYVAPDTLEYNGAARNVPDGDLSRLQTIDIGFLGPLGKDNPDFAYGIAMLHGAQLAIEEANARGGYHGKPFALKVHDDLPLWGASAMEIVRMRFDERVWAMLGSVDAASTHIALRTTLKLELPIVNTATTDPTVTETRIQWILHNFPDDRQQGYALADYVFNQLKLKRVGVLRSTDRYGRKGDEVFVNVARRLGHQPWLEVKYEPNERDFSKQLQMLEDSGIDALVIWGSAPQAGLVLKQMRALGMKQPVFGGSRITYPEVLEIAGPAGEGLVAVSAIDPSRREPQWQEFRQRYLKQFDAEPDPYASYAYDGMNILIRAIEVAGLNRGRIMDALRRHAMKAYRCVSGNEFFDYTLNNIAPATFAKVKNGKFEYWPEQRTDWQGRGTGFQPVKTHGQDGRATSSPAEELIYRPK